MDVDPAASMRCWSADVELAGHLYLLPAMPAADWWPVLIEGDLTELLSELTVPAGAPDPGDMLMDGSLPLAEVTEVLTEALEGAAGRSLHASMVLAAVAQLHWPVINGELALKGFRWDTQPLGAALDAIYYLVLRVLPEERDDGGGKKTRPRDEFLALLENAGQNKAPSGRAVSQFEAMAGPKPEGVRATAGPSDRARSRIRPRQQQPRPDGRSPGPTPPPG